MPRKEGDQQQPPGRPEQSLEEREPRQERGRASAGHRPVSIRPRERAEDDERLDEHRAEGKRDRKLRMEADAKAPIHGCLSRIAEEVILDGAVDDPAETALAQL